MDETGHSGETGAAESGDGAESRDRTPLNGWARPDGPWSNAGSALDPEEDDDVPAWRRPSQEIRPFTRQNYPPERPSGEIRPFGTTSQEVRPFGHNTGDVRPFGSSRFSSGDMPAPSGNAGSTAYTSGEVPTSGAHISGEVSRPEAAPIPPPAAQSPVSPRWPDSRSRYADLIDHLSPNGDQPTGGPGAAPRPEFDTEPRPEFRTEPRPEFRTEPRPETPPEFRPETPPEFRPETSPEFRSDTQPEFRPDTPPVFRPEGSTETRPEPGAVTRPDSLQDRRPALGPLDAPPPSSAPPYPYEGDLDDAVGREPPPPPVGQQRAAVPLERPARPFPAVRPATPGGRRTDWTSTEFARHAREPATAPEGMPRADLEPSSVEADRRRSSYDPVTFPRRIPYDPPPPAGTAPPADPTGYAAPTTYSGFIGRSAGVPVAGPAGEQPSRALPQRVPAEPDVPTVPEPPFVEPSAETPALARIATHLRRGDVLPAAERQDGFDVQAILAAVREVDGVRDASLRSTPAGAHSLRLDLSEGADPAEVSRQVARLLQDRMGLDAAMQGGEAPPVTSFVPTQAGPTGRAPVISAGAVAAPGDDLRHLPTVPQPVRPPEPETPEEPVAEDEPMHQDVPVTAERPAPVVSTASASPVVSPPPVRVPPPEAAAPAGTVETVANGVETNPPRPLEVGERPGPRVIIENVQVNTFGTEATVEVRLAVGARTAAGLSTGPAVDGYLLRLCAMATAQAVDELLAASDHADGPARCFVEHAAAVPFGAMQVAVVVLLLSVGGWVEQLSGSAVVTGDDRHAMVRATLAAVNRRLEALLS